jgi:hypothetical protein
VNANPSLADVREALKHHLVERDDPCQDRGADWPCDVARALEGSSPAGPHSSDGHLTCTWPGWVDPVPVERHTRRLWHTSQHNRCIIWLAGRIQADVNALREAVGLPELGWNDSVPDEEVGRCAVHMDDDCAGQHTHNPPVRGTER